MSMLACLRAIAADELAQGLKNPTRLECLISLDGEQGLPDERCYLEQTWQAIHYLLTGNEEDTESPLAAAIYGRNETGLMLSASPVMYLNPDEVRTSAAALLAINREAIASRYSSKALSRAQIHPNNWEECPDVPEHLLDDYEALERFYRHAAAEGKAAIILIG
jgi:hypothetical protein